MKKKGLTLNALIGIILGIIVLITLIAITYKLIPSSQKEICKNELYWDNLKSELKHIEGGKEVSFFFRNGKEDCRLVSFDFSDLTFLPVAPSSIPSTQLPLRSVNPDPQIAQKQKPALCLCKIKIMECPKDPNSFCQVCEVRDIIKDCYFFKEITEFNVNGNIAQFNTGLHKTINNLFIRLGKKDKTLLINYDS